MLLVLLLPICICMCLGVPIGGLAESLFPVCVPCQLWVSAMGGFAQSIGCCGCLS